MHKVQMVFTKTCLYCGPTKAIFKDLKTRHKFDYEEIDAETPEGQKLVEKYSIMAVPTVIIDGRVSFIGLPPKDKVEAILTR
jgi:glutaredoxin